MITVLSSPNALCAAQCPGGLNFVDVFQHPLWIFQGKPAPALSRALAHVRLDARGRSEERLLLQKVLAWRGQSAPSRSGAKGPEPRKLPPRSYSLTPRQIGGALRMALERAGKVHPFLLGASKSFQTLRFPPPACRTGR